MTFRYAYFLSPVQCVESNIDDIINFVFLFAVHLRIPLRLNFMVLGTESAVDLFVQLFQEKIFDSPNSICLAISNFFFDFCIMTMVVTITSILHWKNYWF
jgi:hypothetical protein